MCYRRLLVSKNALEEDKTYEAKLWQEKILKELQRATQIFGPFKSKHEGYAIMLEEFEELWEDIKTNKAIRLIKLEAIQVAAMALRFLVDCCSEEL